ncbi:MAG: L,D-transpeptidase [Chloroflexota bacterium]|nr:L,D-transpeptidase [Chloroflexota bacterium]
MTSPISRRDFLKLGSIAFGCMAFDLFPEGEGFPAGIQGVGRVTVSEIDIYKRPDYESDPAGKLYRDQLFAIFEIITEPEDAPNSPCWYRIPGGYAHSAHVQRVDNRHINAPLPWVPEEGWLGEITVPYTRAYRITKTYGWVPLYRLYYQSVHWVTGVEEGRDGRPWYKIEDELLKVEYHVPATHVGIIHPKEIAPISPDVPWEDKRIDVSLKEKTLTAYERDEVVLHTLVSPGIPNINPDPLGIPTATPTGRFNIDVKMPSKHMGDGKMTADIHAYELPGVPWVCFFHETGAAFHGTYWHHNFGYRMSHGCVNMTMQDAKWLYRWVLPEIEDHVWEQRGYGTRVHIF